MYEFAGSTLSMYELSGFHCINLANHEFSGQTIKEQGRNRRRFFNRKAFSSRTGRHIVKFLRVSFLRHEVPGKWYYIVVTLLLAGFKKEIKDNSNAAFKEFNLAATWLFPGTILAYSIVNMFFIFVILLTFYSMIVVIWITLKMRKNTIYFKIFQHKHKSREKQQI